MNCSLRVAAAMLSLGLLVTPVTARSVLFDFADSAQLTAGSFNNFIMNGPSTLSIVDAIDSTSATTDIGITASGCIAGSDQNGSAAPSGAAPSGAAATFDPQATNENAFGRALAFGGNFLTRAATRFFTDFHPTASYDFTLFAARTGASDNREAECAVTGNNEESVLLDSANNVSSVAVVSGIFTTAAGTIQVVVAPGPNNNNNNGSRFYYLGALKPGDIPEPASLELLVWRSRNHHVLWNCSPFSSVVSSSPNKVLAHRYIRPLATGVL